MDTHGQTEQRQGNAPDETLQEREYKRLYLNASAKADTFKSAIVSAIVQLESNVMPSQVVQQLKRVIQ